MLSRVITRRSWGYIFLLVATVGVGLLTGLSSTEGRALSAENAQSSVDTTTATPTATCSPSGAWSIVPSPNQVSSTLNGVAAVSSNDVWAVGYSMNETPGVSPLTEHWDGSGWSIVPTPLAGGALLHGVAAVSSNDVWAVGEYRSGGTLTLHWDGSSWSVVPSPNSAVDASLQGVAAISSNDVWAVGTCSCIFGNPPQTLTLHWDGSTWSVVPSPNQGPSRNILYAVSAVSSNDAWAVGMDWVSTPTEEPLTLHWNGSSWSVVPGPSPVPYGRLSSVAAISSNDVWAVGTAGTIHWNGSAWSSVPVPCGQQCLGIYWAVSGVSSNDVWAVGERGSGSSVPLAIHWDGTQWSSVPIPSPGGGYNPLYGVAALASNNVWAAGMRSDSVNFTLTEHYGGGPCATATGTPATMTPTPTPTCPAGTCAFISGTVDVGNHCDDCTTAINLPFPVQFYGQTFTSANVSSNGNLQFSSNDSSFFNPCLPDANFNNALFPYFGDLTTDNNAAACANGCGIFTGVQGSAPNRTFVIEWRTISWYPSPDLTTNFEIVFNENSTSFRFVYGQVDEHGSSATVGIQRDTGSQYIEWSCHQPVLYQGLCITFPPPPCATATPTPPAGTPTNTPTPVPLFVGHVTWEGRPSQPNPLQQLPISLTLHLASGGPYFDFPYEDTDASGFFTVPVTGLPAGTYTWRVKGPQYLANSGTVALTGAPLTQVEMGLMRAGDANGDNLVGLSDFTMLKGSFGRSCGSVGYEPGADFTGDCTVNVVDFVLLRSHFGQAGAPPAAPYSLSRKPGFPFRNRL